MTYKVEFFFKPTKTWEPERGLFGEKIRYFKTRLDAEVYARDIKGKKRIVEVKPRKKTQPDVFGMPKLPTLADLTGMF